MQPQHVHEKLGEDKDEVTASGTEGEGGDKDNLVGLQTPKEGSSRPKVSTFRLSVGFN